MNSSTTTDPFAPFKSTQRETWANFAVNEGFTTSPAAALVRFASVAEGEQVLDVACGTGVVAVTAARNGARVKALDLTPPLLERARENAAIAGVDVEFIEGDAESLPYPDSSFDVVLSQFGHMFAPRPALVTAEMLRVLKPGGRIAFSTWPPEHGMGKFFALLARQMPSPPPDRPSPAPPPQWGDPSVVRERLGDAVTELRFDRGVAVNPALSPRHVLHFMEGTFGPLGKVIQSLTSQPSRLAELRAEILGLIGESFSENAMRQHFLMTRAVKK